jgi:hypothetical protein
MLPRLLGLVIALGGLAAARLPVEGQTPKRGGILTSMIIEYFTQWPHVKNLVAHNSLYNWGRMQDVWLDK